LAGLAVKKPGLAYAAELLNAVDNDDDGTVAPTPVTIIISGQSNLTKRSHRRAVHLHLPGCANVYLHLIMLP